MANKILSTFETLVTATCTMASMANGTGVLSGVIDNTTTRAPMAIAFIRVKTGTSSPTANTPIKLYLIRRSNGGTDLADNALGTAEATITAEPTQSELVGAVVVTTATSATYEKSFILYDLSAKYSLVVWNATGQALHTTAGDHILQVVPIVPEVQ